MRSLSRLLVTVSSVVALVGFGSSPTIAASEEGAAQAAPEMSPLTTGIQVDEGNSRDVTDSVKGSTALQKFATRAKGGAPELSAKATGELKQDYRVLEVDVEKLLQDSQCKQSPDLLILPRVVTGVSYLRGNPDGTPLTDPCETTVIWNEAKDLTQDDSRSSGSSVRAMAVGGTAEMYSRYCIEKRAGTVAGTWMLACYKKWVEKNDGNSAWNYYSIHAWNTCGANSSYYLTSCGRGQEMTSPSGGQWTDYSPKSSSPPNCRSISYGVSLYTVSVGGSYTSCEEQRVYYYSNPGKMSSYWKGEVFENSRSTEHQAAVKVPQNAGRPEWSNWFNTDGHYCVGGLGIPCL